MLKSRWLFQSKKSYSQEIWKRCHWVFPNNRKWPQLWFIVLYIPDLRLLICIVSLFIYLFHTHLDLALEGTALIRQKRLLESDIYFHVSVKWCGAHLKLGASRCKRCPYSELFWSVFSNMRTEYGEIRSIFPYSVRMRENTDQNNSEYGYFSRSAYERKFGTYHSISILIFRVSLGDP